jgi:amino acid transporter
MTQTAGTDEASSSGRASTQLLRSSINFLHIVLMVTAAAAPLVVVSAYIPISISSGAGMATPLTYAATTVILFIFAVGFAQMAKRITSAGAFYTFTTQGLGRPMGLAVGFMIVAAYSMISAAIAGGFGYFASALLSNHFGVNVAWYWCSIFALALMFVISHYRVTFTADILAVLLTLEVLIVLIVCLFTVGKGGASGQIPSAFNPAEWAAAPAVGIGFFLAFWSWIGFETTAIYGEETKDPKESVPRATYIAVITLGVVYTFAAYAGIVGFGGDSPNQASTLLGEYFFELADLYTWHFVRTLMDFLVVSGFFACAFAFRGLDMNRSGGDLVGGGGARRTPDHGLPVTESERERPSVSEIVGVAVFACSALVSAMPGESFDSRTATMQPTTKSLGHTVSGVQLLADS